MATRDEIDMKLRAYVKSHCAPIWWEQGRRLVVNSGSMCVIKTSEKLFGVTNCHVLTTYEEHKAEKPDIFCQLGSAPFDPIANQMSRSEHWDLATFTIPAQTLQHMNYRVWTSREWPPTPTCLDDTVVYGDYPEERRTVPPGERPPLIPLKFVPVSG